MYDGGLFVMVGVFVFLVLAFALPADYARTVELHREVNLSPPTFWRFIKVTFGVEPQAPSGWIIKHNPKPVPTRQWDLDFWHEDYDGPEDDRHGVAASFAEAVEMIRDIEAE